MAKNSTVKVTMMNKGNASVSVRSKAFSGIIPQGRSKGVEVQADHLQQFRADLRKRYPSITVDVEGEDEEEVAPAKTEPEPAKAPALAEEAEPPKEEPAPAKTEASDESGDSEADEGDDGKKKTAGRAKKKG